MPTYDYACGQCGGFEALRGVALRDEPAGCPDCGRPSPRVIASAPRLALLDSDARAAMSVNERARHEPRHSKDYVRLRHPAGCGCCSPTAARRTTVQTADGAKAFPNQRPWMISH